MSRILAWLILLGQAFSPIPSISQAKDKVLLAVQKDTTKPAENPKKSAPSKSQDRSAGIAALAKKFGIGSGNVVADIGAGNGQDSWVFANIVGPSGTVYSEEVSAGLVKSLEAEAGKRKLSHVRPVLGKDDDPGLPIEVVDLAYMRIVYHHFAKPREMLRGLWKALKPGGHLVVIDRNFGTLRDWVSPEVRKAKHFWVAETQVVREAREEGFLFVGTAEDCFESKEHFVLVFQRPLAAKVPGGDPDPFLPLPVQDIGPLLFPLRGKYQHPVFVALGEGCKLISPILEHSSGPGLEIVLEEWATQKDERPPFLDGKKVPSVLTQQGDPHLGPETIDAIFFLDSYHLLIHGKTLFARLREKLNPSGCIYILDRKAKGTWSRREASHRRQIDPKVVQEEMQAAGFALWFTGTPPAADRFLMVFGKNPPDKILPGNGPFCGGPIVGPSPGEWLKANAWRLRGLKTAQGKYLPLPATGERKSVQMMGVGEKEAWYLPSENLVLIFQKTDLGFVLEDARQQK